MKKRNIAVLLSGLLLGAYIGLAAADDAYNTWQATYQDQHLGKQTETSNVVPLDTGELRARAEPAVQTTYQEQHMDSAVVTGDAVPLGAGARRALAEPTSGNM